MDKDELKKDDYPEYAKYEGISKYDYFLAEHHEELFYLPPKELALAINTMSEDELLQFILTIRNGHGMNVNLMIKKLDELNEYSNVTGIFLETFIRMTLLDFIDIHGRKYKDVFHELFLAIDEIWNSEKNPRVKENVTVNTEPPKIIKDLIDAGQLDKDPKSNGKYKPFKTIPRFIQWCYNHGYEEDISKQFFETYIFAPRIKNDRTIEIYMNKAKRGEIKTQ